MCQGRGRRRSKSPKGSRRSPSTPLSRCGQEKLSVMSERICRGCKKLGNGVSYCNLCAVNLCCQCWDLQIAHSEAARGPDNVPHEKTDYEIAKKIRASLESELTEEQQKSLHRKDENTTWFGVAKDETEDLVFEDCGRFASIIADCSTGRRASQYPALVSFVGQTGRSEAIQVR